jgi:hypothetical protein
MAFGLWLWPFCLWHAGMAGAAYRLRYLYPRLLLVLLLPVLMATA